MALVNPVLRSARKFLSILLVLVCVAWVSGEIAQQTLLHRAEKLLADIRTLQAGRSTWSDVQIILQRWASSATSKGACTSDACTVQIDLLQTLPSFLTASPGQSGRNWLPRLVDHAGLRSAAVRAGVVAEHGIVTTSWFGEQVTPPVRDWNPSDNFIPYLSVSSAQTSNFQQIATGQTLLHPNRMVQHKASYIAVTYSPGEDSAERSALMDFHLSCITRLGPCESEGDILPEAQRLWQEQLLSRPSR
jgi:hypothetical protein